ncbi:hypothetical protein J056_004672 [Wallemia ichthyophaga EXF-994]|uniref:BHLH domain-containing protein n=1 Tax=Wallemia ichthyophaga (strain EXF-994 / CBS 113033) TaxID=1299270 RepID=R9AFG6_WALI9|nr:uncharacterized protein J056_004672 [Wallemia ichthyophaga EXF-994]EOR00860.1 hypothetical protein J056_004672 [Wallemia ichthyophaga EXF-994]
MNGNKERLAEIVASIFYGFYPLHRPSISTMASNDFYKFMGNGENKEKIENELEYKQQQQQYQQQPHEYQQQPHNHQQHYLSQVSPLDNYYNPEYTQDDIDLLLTPFLSPTLTPALTPSLTPALTPHSVFSQPPLNTDDHISIAHTQNDIHSDLFSPLTSPALLPTPNSPKTFTTQNTHQRTGSHSARRGASTEARANKIRPSPVMKPLSSRLRKFDLDSSNLEKSPINLDLDAASMPPPPITNQTNQSNLAPVTPASIMNMSSNSNSQSSHTSSSSSGTATPTTQNTLTDMANLSLHSDSNYANVLTGRSINPKMADLLESQAHVAGHDNAAKRASHKVAEQRRRDSLKHSFDDLRALLPPVVDDNDHDSAGVSEGRLDLRLEMKDMDSAQINKGVSKVVLLKLANDYITILNHRLGRRDNIIASLRDEVAELRGGSKCGGDGDGGQDGEAGHASQTNSVDNNTFLHNIDAVEHHIQQAALLAMDGNVHQKRESISEPPAAHKGASSRGKGRIRGASKAAKQYLQQATQDKTQTQTQQK